MFLGKFITSRDSLRWCLFLAGLLQLLFAPRASQPVSTPLTIDIASSAVEPHVNGTPENLAIGWLISDGPEAGVYLRKRTDWTWTPAMHISVGQGARPRDLDLVADRSGRVILTWTALLNGERRLYLARQDAPALAFSVKLIDDGSTSDGTRQDVDVPALKVQPDGSGLLAWQQSENLKYSIHAIYWNAAGTTSSLGLVSGALSGLNPQVLSVDPNYIAWYAVDEIGTHLSLEQWDGHAWQRSSLTPLTTTLPVMEQLLLKLTPSGLLTAWLLNSQPTGLAAGLSRLNIDVLPQIAPRPFAQEILTQPLGDCSMPSLSGQDGARYTVTWRILMGGAQRICIGTALNPTDRRFLVVSPVSQRFASEPQHVTLDNWSAVTWVDSAGDGGSGNVYLAEVDWTIR